MKIKICKAQLRRDLRTLSDMCPFVVLELGGVIKRSTVHVNGGKQPKWGQCFEFKTSQTELKVSVFDEGSFGDQIVGKGVFSLSTLEEEKSQFVVPLLHEGKLVGQIILEKSGSLPRNNFAGQFLQTKIETEEKSTPSKERYQKMATQNILNSPMISPMPNQNRPPQSYSSLPQNQYIQPSLYPQPYYPQPSYSQPYYPQPSYSQPYYPQPQYLSQNYHQPAQSQQNYPQYQQQYPINLFQQPQNLGNPSSYPVRAQMVMQPNVITITTKNNNKNNKAGNKINNMLNDFKIF